MNLIEEASKLHEEKESVEYDLKRIEGIKFQGTWTTAVFGLSADYDTRHPLDKHEFKYIKDYLIRRHTRKRQAINRKIKKFEESLK